MLKYWLSNNWFKLGLLLGLFFFAAVSVYSLTEYLVIIPENNASRLAANQAAKVACFNKAQSDYQSAEMNYCQSAARTTPQYAQCLKQMDNNSKICDAQS